MQEADNLFLSLTDVSLSLPLLSSLFKINKNIFKNKKFIPHLVMSLWGKKKDMNENNDHSEEN